MIVEWSFVDNLTAYGRISDRDDGFAIARNVGLQQQKQQILVYMCISDENNDQVTNWIPHERRMCLNRDNRRTILIIILVSGFPRSGASPQIRPIWRIVHKPDFLYLDLCFQDSFMFLVLMAQNYLGRFLYGSCRLSGHVIHCGIARGRYLCLGRGHGQLDCGRGRELGRGPSACVWGRRFVQRWGWAPLSASACGVHAPTWA